MNRDPNVVLFMVDQLAAKWLEVALGGVCELPNFSRLKKTGTTFTRAITSNPVCCPARATIATGLSTRGHGVLENGYQLDPSLPTFMQVLQNAGWRTGVFGKVHFQPHYRGLRPDYRPYGFDVTHITEDSRGGEWLDWVAEKYPEHYDSVLATIWPSRIPEFSAYGPGKLNLRTRIEQIRRDFQWATKEHPRNYPGASTLPFPQEVSQTNWITMHALEFIRDQSPERPFFAQASYVQPHGPSHVPAEYLERVDTGLIPDSLAAEWVNADHAPRELSRREPIDRDWSYTRHCYFADLCHLDEQLGKVLAALEDSELLETTYLIFVSDHGEMLGDHGFGGKGEIHYDTCIRVPLIVSGPGFQQGQECDALVQLEDVCPTVLDLTGQSMPYMSKMGDNLQRTAEEIPVLPGLSLRRVASGSAPRRRTVAYSESYNRLTDDHLGQWARTVRTERHRYTYYPDGYGEQLFDLIDDPEEQVNLIGRQNSENLRSQLRDQLLEQIILQDYPKTRRELYALGVH